MELKKIVSGGVPFHVRRLNRFVHRSIVSEFANEDGSVSNPAELCMAISAYGIVQMNGKDCTVKTVRGMVECTRMSPEAILEMSECDPPVDTNDLAVKIVKFSGLTADSKKA